MVSWPCHSSCKGAWCYSGAAGDQALVGIDGGVDQPGQACRLLASWDARKCLVEAVLQSEMPGVERAVAVVVPGSGDVSGRALQKGGRASEVNRSAKPSSVAWPGYERHTGIVRSDHSEPEGHG